MNRSADNEEVMTFGGHLEVLRKMLFRIVIVVVAVGAVVFCFKNDTFSIMLAPRNSDFVTFRVIEQLMHRLGSDFHFELHAVPLISTELSAQFMTHITVSCILAFLIASPYILWEFFRFISPALYDNEKRYSGIVAFVIFFMFVIGLLTSYYILFPISYQFLATYQVDDAITNTITLDSYISTFATLAFMMGIVFQLPLLAFIMGKMGIITADLLKNYRAYAFIIILILSAIITPPDIFTLILVSVPIYALYELSILVLSKYGSPSAYKDEDSAP